MMHTLQTELRAWAERTVSIYNDYIRRHPHNPPKVYTQSDLSVLTSSPEVLILGISPESPYSELETSSKDGWGLLNPYIQAESFLKGNPKFMMETNSPHWANLRSIFHYAGMADILRDERRFVYTNLFHAGIESKTKITQELRDARYIEPTFELIRLLQPKLIICLDNPHGFTVMQRYIPLNPQEILVDLSTALWDDKIPICSIPDPNKPYEQAEHMMVGGIVGCIYRGEVSTEGVTPNFLRRRFKDSMDRYLTKVYTDYSFYELLHEYMLLDISPFDMIKKYGNRVINLGKRYRFTIEIEFQERIIALSIRQRGRDIRQIAELEELGFSLEHHWEQVRYAVFIPNNHQSLPTLRYLLNRVIPIFKKLEGIKPSQYNSSIC